MLRALAANTTMTPPGGHYLPTMDQRAIYRIRVQGCLDSGWSARIGDLEISQIRALDGTTESVLEGVVQDQAALAGILDTLYELHLPIVLVERVRDVE
jgi:hypothetical protein